MTPKTVRDADGEYSSRRGKAALRLPPLGVGCWAFGGGEYWGRQEQADVAAIVKRAVELGLNYFDTAEGYNQGRSEESLGRALKGIPRDQVLIGTKVGPHHMHAQVLPAQCDESLRRLGTDYIDLYMVHWPMTPMSIRQFGGDPLTCPQAEEAFEGLRLLRQQGKVRFIGVSNFGVTRLLEAVSTGTEIAANELPYNLLARAIENEILPLCERLEIGVIGYMALLQGVLADKYRRLDDVPLWRRRTRHFDPEKNPEARHGGRGFEAETEESIQAIRRICVETGHSMPSLALKWALANKGMKCVLVGSRTREELEDNAQVVQDPLPSDVLRELDQSTAELKKALGPSFDYYESDANDRTR